MASKIATGALECLFGLTPQSHRDLARLVQELRAAVTDLTDDKSI
jgi:hypothetical protein